MNCQEFDSIVQDLAQSRLMDARSRERATTHTAGCPRCAVRLADERALVAGLKALSASSENEAAPPRIEEALLAAFRKQTPAWQSNVVAMPIRRSRIPFWGLAAAAALLLAAFGFAASRLLNPSPILRPDVTLAPSPFASPIVRPAGVAAEPNDKRIAAAIRDVGGKSSSKPRGKRTQHRAFADGSYVTASLGEFTSVPSNQEAGQQVPEVVTDFLPLFQAVDAQPLESGQVIRVQMPRTALASFGLPVNQERADTTVKADVLLAEDGSARAIRFVR